MNTKTNSQSEDGRSAPACSASKGRMPSFERGCKGKVKLGRKHHKKNADRLARKYGHALGVYWCRWCGNYHATSKIDGEKIYEGLIHISLPNAEVCPNHAAIAKAMKWREQHTAHVGRLEADATHCFVPCREDLHHPELWKAGSWKWLREFFPAV